MKHSLPKIDVTIPLADMVEVLKHIEVMLISLHRVGSYYAEDIEKCDAETIRIIDTFKYSQRLAKMRTLLSSALEDSVPKELDDQITTRQINRVKLWHPPKG